MCSTPGLSFNAGSVTSVSFGLLRQLEDGENEGPVSGRRIRMDVHSGGRSKFFKQFTMYLIDIQDVVLVEVES